MKKFIAVAITFILMLGCVFMSACSEKSNAVTRDELIRENFAAEKEAEDDAKGREHIEIPEDADTIEIDDEEWIVLRSIEEFEEKIFYSDGGLEKNYILANDIDLKMHQSQVNVVDNYTFSGKLNGNNFKFYSSEETGGFGSSLFSKIRNAVIENLIFSSSDGYWHGSTATSNAKYLENVLISAFAEDSLIKNCINYFQVKNTKINFGGFINYSYDSVIENCINYADSLSHGGIVCNCVRSTISNCINYGNLVSSNGIGGISVNVYDGCKIENCVNYGKIVGTMGVGGIIGGVVDVQGDYVSIEHRPNNIYTFVYFDENNFTDNQIISRCKNYGEIYVLKENGSNKVEEIDRSNVVLTNKVLLFGGIAGSIAKVENCENYGNFYGLESVGKKVTVHFIGGVVGVARQVENCTNTGTMVIEKGKADNIGDICGGSIDSYLMG